MFGFLFGTLCLIALIVLVRRGRWGHGHGCGYGRGRWRHGPGGFGSRWLVRGLFERLGTTPGQEKAVVAAMDELREALGGQKVEWNLSRKDLAQALRVERFDARAQLEKLANLMSHGHGVVFTRRGGAP